MNVQQRIDELRTQRAAEWLQILREDENGSHDGFVRWLTESPLNLEEYLKLEALSRETRSLLRSADFNRGTLAGKADSNVVAFASSSPHAAVAVPKHRRWSAVAGAAAASLFVVLAGLWVYDQLRWQHYSTDASAQRTIELADGSTVYLNTRSELKVRINFGGRDMRLSRGEALFDVAKDGSRPFRVHTSNAMVEALGTQFNVNTRDNETRVAVLEGRVRVSRGTKEETGFTQTALAAGEAAHVPEGGMIERTEGVDIAQAVSWSQPELVFNGTALEEAVAQFNHHRRGKHLRLEGVAPDSHHYTGIFSATDVDSFAALLTREADLRVESGADEIVIRTK